jgi:molybdate transport system substrate-binding protein
VDLFLSADLEKMEGLERAGRVDPASRRNLLSNQLVIVAPIGFTLAMRSPTDLVRSEVKRIALAEPSSVPAGIYAKKYLREQGLWDRIKAKVIPVSNVRATLVSVESGNVDAGFIYRTDAAISKKVEIVYQVPKGEGPEIIYPAAIVKYSKKKKAAADFLSFVSSDPGKRIFQRYGFIVLE